MGEEELRKPNQDEVRAIMNEVYNVWFKKYKNAETDQDFQNMIRESHEIYKKYQFTLCSTLLLELSNVIESYYKERVNANVKDR